jgi:hypothetical protein
VRLDRSRLRWPVAVALVASAAGTSYWYVEAQTIADRCGSDGLVAMGYRHEWKWSRFAYVCVYEDHRGDEIARRFPDRPSLRDLG